MQNKHGPTNYVYVIGATGGLGPVKVGITNDLERRLSQIQSGSPVKLSVIYYLRLATTANVRGIEQAVHRELARDHAHGEWFNVSAVSAWDCVQIYCEGVPRSTASITGPAIVMALHPLAKGKP